VVKSDRKGIPLVVVLSGPSAVGKDAVISRMKQKFGGFHHVVTATTRPQRRGEVDGQDYYFLSKHQFEEGIKQDKFLEYAEVYGNFYGVLKSEVKKALQKGEDVILKVDVQGAATLRKTIPDSVFIFLIPSSLNDLADRLTNRNADPEDSINLRVGKAREELGYARMFDYQVVNVKGRVEKAVDDIKEIIDSNRGKRRAVRII